MTSSTAAAAEYPRAAQDSNEGRSARSTIQCPSAPRIVPDELPTVDEPTQQHPVAINHGDGQWIPEVLLFRNDIRPKVDSRLAYGSESRAIALPAFTCMTVTPAHLWGAVGNPVLVGENDPTTLTDSGNPVLAGGNDRKRVHFERAFDPATEPSVMRMIIRTDTDNIIIADAGQGRSYVTVVDVQRAVINWMKETRTRSGTNNLTRRFSKRLRMVDGDGADVEVEVWVWKGLRSLSTDMAHWQLYLGED
ncbi:hypothetical protein AGABI1DRAFT_89095 [Agaricus bisporus var. burnettii JB137-S8]|uniref:Uncharacterized protein n=1 Tax=Agaricus bisporus var. burnettii (strain JB137-S8 / ATCC MYA-4627 / FGSC 10392) TaxID=597362 RepID=K5XLE3_AGABU|nr:uncharacterized protein AGABI1DRAFT_89095 [Agaricus bisporus var. burnettii JB137-S8]EKM84393.1 hypothetical protein AGABI1DRAFT_89095 [Agaricus bisporus var. burnettii JB137-S8]